MMSYITQAVIGAVVGFAGNYIPMIKNNQTTITNVALGLVGSLGGNAVAGAAGADGSNILTTLVSGAGGSVLALLAGKLFGQKAA
jgi:uncharacterized membrane protein YeaQ/YmgE (transglycosylase-associated protein family)